MLAHHLDASYTYEVVDVIGTDPENVETECLLGI